MCREDGNRSCTELFFFFKIIESCKKLYFKMKAGLDGREITAKIKDAIRKRILRKNTDTEIYQREKAGKKMAERVMRRK